ncbi:MAG: ABC transporter substrate-binding protein [Pyrinomonadaceae bacterium]
MRQSFTKPVNFLVLFILSFVSACTAPQTGNTNASSSGTQTTGTRGGSLSYRITSPVNTLNYLMARDEPTVLATLYLMNDRLVVLDHSTQKYVPSLAESYTPTPDGRTVDVILREGLKFSDGQPLTTADVAFTLAAAYDERTKSPVFRDSLLVNNKQIEAKVIDPRKMQLIFPEKVASVENYLENFAIIPKHVLENDFNAGTLAESWKVTADPNSVVTSGAFMVESVQPGERVTLKRNPNYWKKDSEGVQLPYLDHIVLEVITDANNTAARLGQGNLDIADRIRTTDFASLKQVNGATKAYDSGPGLNTDHLWFNLNSAKKTGESLENTPKFRWFNDKRFRQAVAHAVDRDSIASSTFQDLATPLSGFVPAGDKPWLSSSLPRIEYSEDRAEDLLTEAGFTEKTVDGQPALFDSEGNRVEFTIIVNAENEPRKLMAAVIQEDLADLGMAVQIAPIESAQLTERWTASFDYDAVLHGISVTALDPSSFSNLLLSSADVHQWHPKQAKPASEWEAKIDELFARQAQETDLAARKKAFDEIQAIMADEMPLVPIVSRHVITGVNQRVGNYAPSSILPFSMWNADRLYIRN